MLREIVGVNGLQSHIACRNNWHYSGPGWAEKSFMRRWFPADEVEVPEAKFLDVILYSREQLVQEYEAMPGKGDPASLPVAPWGIISIKAQDEDHETPMQVTAILYLSSLLGQVVAVC